MTTSYEDNFQQDVRHTTAETAGGAQSPSDTDRAVPAESPTFVEYEPAAPNKSHNMLFPDLDEVINNVSAVTGEKSEAMIGLAAEKINEVARFHLLNSRKSLYNFSSVIYFSGTAISKLDPDKIETLVTQLLGRKPREGNSIFLSLIQASVVSRNEGDVSLLSKKQMSEWSRALENCARRDVLPENFIAYVSQPGVGLSKLARIEGAANQKETAADDVSEEEPGIRTKSHRALSCDERTALEKALMQNMTIDIDLEDVPLVVSQKVQCFAFLETSEDGETARIKACRVLESPETTADQANALLRKIKLGAAR